MLYPKSKEPQLSEALFRNPTREYRGTPFWAWNCQLDRNELLWQLEILKKMGMGGGHMHVRTGMTTPYLSDEHMSLIKGLCRKMQAGRHAGMALRRGSLALRCRRRYRYKGRKIPETVSFADRKALCRRTKKAFPMVLHPTKAAPKMVTPLAAMMPF